VTSDTPRPIPPAAATQSATSPAVLTGRRAVVIGGGISGLAAARRLALAGCSVTVFEASDRLGGLIRGVQLGDHLVDVGAEAFAIARPETLELIHNLGLDDELVWPAQSSARIRSVDAAGQPQVFEIPRGVFGIPASLSDPLVVGAIGAEAVAEASQLDSQPWQLDAPGTLAELVETRLGKGVLDVLVTPVVSGVHASHPEFLEADVVSPGLFARAKEAGSLVAAVAQIVAKRGQGDPASGGSGAAAASARPGSAVASLRGGMNRLIDALAANLAELGVKVVLNAPVQSVLPAGDGVRVVLAGGHNHSVVTADLVVLATPPPVAGNILGSLPALASPLSRIRAVNVTVVALQAQNRYIGRAPLGSGVLVAPGDTKIAAKASTHSSAKWDFIHNDFGPDQHLIRLSYGRDGDAPAADTPEAIEALIATARQDAAALYGIDAIDVSHAVTQEWPGSLIQARTGHLKLLKELAEAQKQYPNLAIVGAGLGGNGITGILAKIDQQMKQIGA